MRAPDTGCYGNLMEDVITDEIDNDLSVKEELDKLEILSEDAG